MTLRIGITGGGSTVDRIIDQAAEAENDGFASLWYGGGGRGMDVLTLLPLVGRATSRIELGTAIVQTYPRHPILMAQQAATVAQAIGDGRFTLGVGVSHRPVIEYSYGLSYDTNARHLREYLAVLGALLEAGTVRFAGEEYQAATDPASRSTRPSRSSSRRWRRVRSARPARWRPGPSPGWPTRTPSRA